MKKYLRIAALCLVLLTLLSLGACGDTNSDAPGTEAGTQQEVGMIVLNESGKEYKVVRGEDASDDEIALAVYVRNSIREMTGFCPDIATDFYKTEDQIGAYEILIGTTNRAETAAADAKIDGNGYIVAVINGKIVIDATSIASLEAGCECFLDEIAESPDGIRDNLCVTKRADVPAGGARINGVNLKDFAIYTPGKKAYELPINTAFRYFSRYCGLDMKYTNSQTDGHELIIGGTKPDGTEYGKFEIGIWYKDGDLHLGCANPTMAEQVLNVFFAKYLSTETVADLQFPEDGTQVYSLNQPDNWDDADPKFLTIQDKIVRGCYKLECILQYDTANGHPFTYQGDVGWRETIALSRAENGPKNRTVNCVILGNWVLKDAGFFADENGVEGIYNHTYPGNSNYDGTPGWTTTKGTQCETWFAENMIVTRVYEEHKNVVTLTKEGKIYPGAIIGFLTHNQTVLPLGYAFDGGRFSSNMVKAETGGEFKRWVGPNPCGTGQTVGYVVQAKDAEAWQE